MTFGPSGMSVSGVLVVCWWPRDPVITIGPATIWHNSSVSQTYRLFVVGMARDGGEHPPSARSRCSATPEFQLNLSASRRDQFIKGQQHHQETRPRWKGSERCWEQPPVCLWSSCCFWKPDLPQLRDSTGNGAWWLTVTPVAMRGKPHGSWPSRATQSLVRPRKTIRATARSRVQAISA